MENSVLKIPFFVRTRCPHCGNENRINLQSVSLKGENSFKYPCMHCKQTIDLFEDEKFVDFARLFAEHGDEYRDWIKQGLAEMVVQLFDENAAEVDDGIKQELQKIPKEKLRELVLAMLWGEVPKTA